MTTVMRHIAMAMAFALALLADMSLAAQEEHIYNGFAECKDWNTAYIKDLVVDTNLVLNVIVIQAYTDEDWDRLLEKLGKKRDEVCKHKELGGVSLFLINWNNAEEGGSVIESEIYASCNKKTILITFPRNLEQSAFFFEKFLKKHIKKETNEQN